MSNYTIRNNNNNNNGNNYSTGDCNYSHRDRSAISNSSVEGGIENGLTKSVWFPSSLENKYDRSIFPDGPASASFEKYVHNIFRPGNKLPKLSTTLGNSISVDGMLRTHDLLGSATVNGSCKLFYDICTQFSFLFHSLKRLSTYFIFFFNQKSRS